MTTTSRLHAGERAVQQHLGVHERMAEVMGQVVRDHMPEQHRELFGKLPTLMVGSLDAEWQPWASVLHGAPGFITAPDAQHLHLAARPGPGDPWLPQVGTPVGLLGLEPHTRRRNRMNGSIVSADARGLTVHVDQSFGNCPKYIQARSPQAVDRGPVPAAETLGPGLTAAALHLVERADTLFIASAAPDARAHAGASGVDVSHRGGPPGFVHTTSVAGHTVLTLPDYRGNNFFNTLGNLVANPRAGLLFIDYREGHLLHLAATASVVWDGPELAAFPGAQRLLRITVQRGLWRAQALPLRWSAAELAPQFTTA
ncbi:MAG: pyridoxamine 5'-phosphate oxidase family protein [Rhizobacter sp.]|nr:pyridoxamine 5'-phosphate oxidase family protein [Rhizobacter sp.]